MKKTHIFIFSTVFTIIVLIIYSVYSLTKYNSNVRQKNKVVIEEFYSSFGKDEKFHSVHVIPSKDEKQLLMVQGVVPDRESYDRVQRYFEERSLSCNMSFLKIDKELYDSLNVNK